MKHKQFVKNIALSALMVSAIAVPAAANAESGTKPANLLTASQEAPLSTVTLKALPSVAAVQLADPLKLAKEYAPDTVTDWEQTLEKHKSLAGESAVITLGDGEVSFIPAGDVPVELTKSTLSSAEAIKILPEQKIEGIENVQFNLVTKPAEPAVDAGGSISLPKGDSAQNLTVAFAALQSAQNDDSFSLTVSGNSVMSLTAAPGGDSIIQGRIDLDRAVQSKDAEAIKKSLAELLKLYKAQIEKLEQAAE